jgi:hypothetical protein
MHFTPLHSIFLSSFLFLHFSFTLTTEEYFQDKDPSECGETYACDRCGVPGRRGELGRGLCHGGHPRGLHQPQVCLHILRVINNKRPEAIPQILYSSC